MRLAILTSGGDAPGCNAAIEAAVRYASSLGHEVYGVERGFAGLAAAALRPLTLAEVDGISARGGTILGTSRDRTLADDIGKEQVIAALKQLDIAGVIIEGGDGSIGRGATTLAAMGVPCVAIPCSIDNDVPGTDRTLGFDSACNRAISLADGIKDTAQALHGRIFTLETLGGHTGYIAMAVAEATYADLLLIPEYPLDMDYAAAHLRQAVAERGYALAVASEGAGDVHSMCDYLAEISGHRVRLSTLGHAQRGGAPSFFDRWLARCFGESAVRALISGETSAVTVCHGYDVSLAPLSAVVLGQKAPARNIYNTINGLD